MLRFFVLFSISFLFMSASLQAVTQDQVNVSRPYIVSIKTRSTVAAYNSEGTTSGTGSIIDKKNGILLTNAHVVGVDKVVPYYEITLFNGRELRANLLYVDPWHDFAFLKVRSEDIDKLPAEVPIENREVTIGEQVYMIGKNENKPFSPQPGMVANPYESTDLLPNQVFRISLNAQGGASGSPVFTQSNQAVGLVHASDGLTSAFALPISYAVDALKAIREGKIPNRRSCGIILRYSSLDDYVRFYNFPSDIADKYRLKFPNSSNRVLAITSILVSTPAETIFEVGDVVTHVNGTEIGPNLYLFDKIINEATLDKPDDEVEVTVVRRGKVMSLKVKTYDLHQRKIKKILQFGGAFFYEADDAIVRRTGARDHRVFITNIRPGSSFFENLPMLPRSSSTLVCLTKINEKNISSLQDLIEMIPSLMEQKDFSLVFKNYGVEFGIDSLPIFAQVPQTQSISYSRHDGLPEIYTFKPETRIWNVETINTQNSLGASSQPVKLSPEASPHISKNLCPTDHNAFAQAG
ncbi:MAG: S1C family serine protease [Alphaproteobacteria bacterium]|nr:S1C family serine protease [Alphaproteobacteria bacterium]